jgi:hypothetical protein
MDDPLVLFITSSNVPLVMILWTSILTLLILQILQLTSSNAQLRHGDDDITSSLVTLLECPTRDDPLYFDTDSADPADPATDLQQRSAQAW